MRSTGIAPEIQRRHIGATGSDLPAQISTSHLCVVRFAVLHLASFSGCFLLENKERRNDDLAAISTLMLLVAKQE